MKDFYEYMLTGTCTVRKETGENVQMEFFGMDRHIKKYDFRSMIFSCLFFVREIGYKDCCYKVRNNRLNKEVIAITVFPNEFFDDMYEVTVNDKPFGWIYLTKDKKYPHLAIY